jgi:FkbM family methyltransferase
MGYEVHRLPEAEATTDTARPVDSLGTTTVLSQIFAAARPDLLIDVGANVGQFAGWARTAGFGGPIVSFEPQVEEHGYMTGLAAPDPLWRVAPRMALGAEAGVAELNVAANSESSSLLGMLDVCVENAPEAAYVGSVETPVMRLDDALDASEAAASRAFLKIDAQGYEFEVLSGGPRTLDAVSAVWLELSLEPLYDGAAPTSAIVRLLAAAGLELSYVARGFAGLDGRMLQIDAGFTRPA